MCLCALLNRCSGNEMLWVEGVYVANANDQCPRSPSDNEAINDTWKDISSTFDKKKKIIQTHLAFGLR